MTNWEEIHSDFAESSYHRSIHNSQQIWEIYGLTYQDSQEWIASGFNPKDYDEVKGWKLTGINAKQAQERIRAGVGIRDYRFVSYLKE